MEERTQSMGFSRLECKCANPECLKPFIRAVEHMYYRRVTKFKKVYYCSYTCYRKAGG